MKKMHIFNHSHWDRDWFLPSEFINQWLDDLFEELFKIFIRVPDYQFILDGQTLLVEDYLSRHPEKEADIKRYAQKGNLILGPVYGQIDWRAVSEESLMRNLFFGTTDAKKYGNLMPIGWLLDNFGHCSQSPQIHNAFGIHDVFVWRGPRFEGDHISSEFLWESPDGSQVFSHFLMSGYRNFYNLTDTQDLIEHRVEQIKKMLSPFTPHDHLLLMDGYDIDIWPEDPFDYLKETDGYIRSTPERYMATVKPLYIKDQLPTLRGELYSGKYSCIFPGSLSVRSYLRLQNALVEKLLAYYLEPLQALIAKAGGEINLACTEKVWREILKCQLHDSLGGVSVDQVHDKMEHCFRQAYDFLKKEISHLLAQVPAVLNLKDGTYVYLPSPYSYAAMWLKGENGIYQVESDGMGFYPILKTAPLPQTAKNADTFTWQNDFYTFEIGNERILLNGNPVGILTIEGDKGDTYNADPYPFKETGKPEWAFFKVNKENEAFAQVELSRTIRQGDISIKTRETLFFNQTPIVNWQISVDSEGTNYRLRFVYATNDSDGQVYAKMPYDIVQRPRVDSDYFGQEIPANLAPVLLAAREVNQVKDFPFQGFVALSGEEHTKALFAKGLREYSVDADGNMAVTMKRSVEWLAKSDLNTRIGDAGPYMYVPGAKDERETRFDLALVDMAENVHAKAFLKWFYLFEYGFMVFKNVGHAGTEGRIRIWDESLPWSGVQNLPGGESVIRVYNPYTNDAALGQSIQSVDPFGKPLEEICNIPPKAIRQFIFAPQVNSVENICKENSAELLEFPTWSSGAEKTRIEQSRLDELAKLADRWRREKAEAIAENISEDEDVLAFHRKKHTIIRLERQILEAELSILLNKFKIEGRRPELLDEIQQVGKKLNLVRRQRRTYDYVLSLYENK